MIVIEFPPRMLPEVGITELIDAKFAGGTKKPKLSAPPPFLQPVVEMLAIAMAAVAPSRTDQRDMFPPLLPALISRRSSSVRELEVPRSLPSTPPARPDEIRSGGRRYQKAP